MPGAPVAMGGGVGKGEAKNKASGIAMVVFAAFGGILFGYDTGTISGLLATRNWLETFGTQVGFEADGTTPKFNITTSQQSLVVSILSIGTFFGALAAGFVGDLLGRRGGLVFTSVVFSVGVAMQTGTRHWAVFNVGRVIAGLGVGLVSVMVPMYQSECSPKWIRGAVVSCYQWTICLGLLLAAIFSNAFQARTSLSSWQIPIGVQFIWAFVLAAGMIFLPESPRWLIKKGCDGDAAKSLGRLVGAPADDPDVQQEIEDIRVSLKEEIELGETGWADCFKNTPNKIRLRTLTGMGLQAWQQLTGVNFIFYYGTFFFKNSGITNPFMITVATNVVNVGMTIPGMWLVDHVGRRRMLLLGAVGMGICQFLIAIIGVTISVDNGPGQKALIALVCLYIAWFAVAWGPIAWVVIGEIFPLNVRAKCMGLSAASNWIWNWGIGYATPYLVNEGAGNANLGSKVFFIWGSCCMGCFLFTYFFIPEVKGLSLEQIDILYQNTTPRKSLAYRNQLIAHNVHVSDTNAIARINSAIAGAEQDAKDAKDGKDGKTTAKEVDVEKAEDVQHEEKPSS